MIMFTIEQIIQIIVKTLYNVLQQAYYISGHYSAVFTYNVFDYEIISIQSCLRYNIPFVTRARSTFILPNLPTKRGAQRTCFFFLMRVMRIRTHTHNIQI